ncbi:MAG: hypothetical protein ACLRMJ_06565 [Alistipes finegoldii]
MLPFHPNGMLFEGLKAGNVADSWTIYSIGGGALANGRRVSKRRTASTR